MQSRRPVECPICGHERIERRPMQLAPGAGVLRMRATAWTCRLCGYQWAGALPPVDDARELA